MSKSAKKPLQIKDLSISRMPGFSDGMKPFKDFSEGINIIAGPNASGKSTTAHAIQKLIWQNDAGRVKIGGHASLNGDSWTLRVDSGQKICQRNGVPDEISGIPAAEEQNRYMLALHTLMTANGKDLAKQIIRESVGGYDPEKAADNLGYSSKVSTTGISNYKEFQNAETAVRNAQDAQKAVKAEEKKLTELYRQWETAGRSDRMADFYKIAIDAKRADKRRSEHKAEVDDFPAELENAHGEELKRVEELDKDISDAEVTIETANETISQSEERLEELSIPQTGVPAQMLDELEERVDRLEEIERDLASLEIERKALEKKYSDALKRVGDDADPNTLREIDLKDIGDLDRFLEDAHRLASEKRILKQEIDELRDDERKDALDPEKVRDGLSQLSYWLKETSEHEEFSAWIVYAIAALAIVSVVSGYFIPVAGGVGFVLILFLAIYGWMQIGKNSDRQAEQTRVNDFNNTGLKSPEAWDPGKVVNRLDELVTVLRDARWQEKVSLKIESAQKRLKNVESRLAEIKQRKAGLEKRLTVLPEMPFDNPEGYSQLASYLSAVRAWQDADSDLMAQKEAVDGINDNLKQEQAKVSELIKPFSNDVPHDASEAKAIYKELKRQEEKRSGAVKEISRQTSAIESAKKIIDKKTKDLTEIYKKLGLDTGEKERLRHLIGKIAAYQDAKKNYELAKGEFERYRRSLEQHSLFEEESPRLEEMTLDQAEAYLSELQLEAEKLEPLRNEIAEIEADIKTVKSGNSLEHALSDRDKAVENLRTHYEENLQKITGRLLADTIKEEMREQNRPKVFKEASRLFNRITKGRYELQMDEMDEPEFIAFDTVEHIGKNLDQLSSGTRIQLLMAVRLAFVETQETSIKLPILADELLANSDDVRAEAIIEALTEISRDGRQVFYFTAQGDEVAKWDSYLKDKGGVNHKVFFLSGERGEKEESQIQSQAQREPIRLIKDVAEPGLLNHTQYADVLNITEFKLLTDDPARLHLWYLVEDPETLHAALSAGIDYWGSLKSYVDAGGVIDGLSDQHIKEMEEKADLLERYLRFYRQGRPKPIDRSVLENSGAVSDSFIEAVSNKLKQLQGNPADLIVALRNSEVSGFRTNKIDDLEAYLLENGYIDNRELMDQTSLILSVQAFISKLSLSKKEAQDFLNRLLS